MSGVHPKALDHVGLLVSDMDRSLRFYCDGLGLELLRRSDRASGVASAVLRVGAQEMNLFSDPLFGTAPEARRPRQGSNATGIDHFCLEVEAASVAELSTALANAGITVTKGPTKRRDGVSLFVTDPDGVRVELIVKAARGDHQTESNSA